MLRTFADFYPALVEWSTVVVCESKAAPRSDGNRNANGTLPADTAVIGMAGPICSYLRSSALVHFRFYLDRA